MHKLEVLNSIKIKPMSWLKCWVYAILIGLIYCSPLSYMASHDWPKDDYSHCALIPVVVLYLVWEKREILSKLPSVPSHSGFWMCGVGIFLYLLGELGGEYFTLYMSFWFVIVGFLWLHHGWQKIKTIWFALVMMLAMFPFPNFVNVQITFQLRLISSKLGVWMLRLYGMSVYREGNIIDLGFTQLQVIDACSGLRYVIPLTVLGLLLAYWFKGVWWKKVVLFLSSIPVAIFINSFRIAVTGVLYSMFGAEVAEGFFHGFSGWLIFMFAIPCLLLEMWVLGRIPPKGPRDEERKAKGESNTARVAGHESQTTVSQIEKLKEAFLQPNFIVAIVILLLTFGLSHGIEFREKVPVSKPFNQFPMQVGEWKGTQENMDQEFLDVLKFSDYITADYKDKSGKMINFYVAYYQDQRKGESTHSPETCLPASGWEFAEAGNSIIPAGDGKSSIKISRAFIIKDSAREIVYYWFPQRGRILTSLYQLKIYAFWDALTRQRTDGALVRVITPISEKEKLDDAEQRLKRFVQLVLPVLDEFIPK